MSEKSNKSEVFSLHRQCLRLIILSWGLIRSFGDKLAITLSRNFVSVCNFKPVNDFYIRYGTLPHTFSHCCHTLGKLHTLWEVWESVRKSHQICVLKNQAKNQFEKIENNRTKKIHFFEKFSFPATPSPRPPDPMTVGKMRISAFTMCY